MRYLCVVAILLLPTVAHAADGDIVKSDASVRIADGQTAGNIRVKDGSISLGERSKVQAVSVRDGGISMAADAVARELQARDGAVSVGARGHVTGDVTVADGAVHLGHGAEIGGRVSTKDGAVSLDGAHVARGISTSFGAVSLGPGSKVEGGIKTVDAGITIGAGAKVTGGLVVEPGAEDTSCKTHCVSDRTTSFSSLMGRLFGIKPTPAKPPRVVIGPGATVEGTLEFHRSVDLEVSDRATIGPVKGATAKTFNGATP